MAYDLTLICPNTGSCGVYERFYRGRTDGIPNVIRKTDNGYVCSVLQKYIMEAKKNMPADYRASLRKENIPLEAALPDCLNLKSLNDHRRDVRLQGN